MKIQTKLFFTVAFFAGALAVMAQTNVPPGGAAPDAGRPTLEDGGSKLAENPAPLLPPSTAPALAAAEPAATNGVVAPPALAPAPAPAARTDEIAMRHKLPLHGSPAESSDEIVPLIQIDEAPLPDAIKTLARQAGLNFQFDPRILNPPADAAGKVPSQPPVSFRWENVTAMEALLALLENYNLQIVRDPKTKIARITVKDTAALEPLLTHVFQLDYANPTNLVSILTNTISSRGRVVADIRTSQLVVSATEKELDSVEALIKKLDTQTRQILIEARFIEVNQNPRTSKGVDWSDTLSKQNISFGNGVTLGTSTKTTPGITATTPTPGGRTLASGGSSAVSTLTTLTGGTVPGISANTMAGLSPSTFFLNADGVKVALSFLNSDADAESIATPRAVTLENVPTELSVVRNIPIFEQQQGANTGGSVQANTVKPNYMLAGPNGTILNEIGIKLLVTPRIFGSSNVFLDLRPEISDRELKPETVILNNQASSSPIFNRRKLQTQAMIPSGYTLVLGGLRQDSSSKTFTKVPLLGDLPGIGLMFRKDEKAHDKRDLIIFVTPTIIRVNDFQPAPESSDFLHQTPKKTGEEKWSAFDAGKPVDWTKPVKEQYYPKDPAKEPLNR